MDSTELQVLLLLAIIVVGIGLVLFAPKLVFGGRRRTKPAEQLMGAPYIPVEDITDSDSLARVGETQRALDELREYQCALGVDVRVAGIEHTYSPRKVYLTMSASSMNADLHALAQQVAAAVSARTNAEFSIAVPASGPDGTGRTYSGRFYGYG